MGQVHSLEKFHGCDATELGNLCIWLGQFCQQGYPVRPAWALSTDVFEPVLAQALADIEIAGEGMLPSPAQFQLLERPQQLQRLARLLRSKILSIPFPAAAKAEIAIAIQQTEVSEWRLQPSLVSSSNWSRESTQGLWDTPVVKSDLDTLTTAIQQIWAQSFTAQNLLFWFSQDCPLADLKLAIVAQSLGQVQQSGLLHLDAQGMQIEAVWGDSSVIPQGDVLPTRQTWTWDDTLVSHAEGYQPLLYASPSWPSAFQPPPEVLDTEAPKRPSQVGSVLQVYGLNPVLHPHSALTPDLLADLRQIGQQLWTDLQTPALVEWVYASPDCLGIVGFQPVTERLEMIKSQKIARSQESHCSASELWPPKNFEGSISAPLASDSEPKLIGLAASPGQAQGLAWVVTEVDILPTSIPPDAILVIPLLNPTWLPILQQVAGVITEQGGLTSHGAILARELGIPAVVAIATATQLICPGDSLWLDGTRGQVKTAVPTMPAPNPTLPAAALAVPASSVGAPATPATVTQLWVNLSQLSSLPKIQNIPIAGIGLLRAEFMALDLLEQQHPLQWLQDGRGAILEHKLCDRIQQFLQGLHPRPVFYRFLDLHSAEFQSLKGYPDLALQSGADLRGAISYQYFPALFQMELAALQRVQNAGYDNLHLLIPFVRSVSEFEFCQTQIQKAGLMNSGNLQIWIMAEVPSVLFQLADYQQAGVQGLSIGTNDLTRLLLGIDREQPPTHGLDARHPAVKRAIAALIRQSRDLGLHCSICGDAPALYPELIESLVEWGITGISVSVAALETTYQAILRAEQRLFL